MQRLPIVGVMGSGSEEWAQRTEPLGRLLAALGVHLLTGGGGGVMTAVTRAFVETTGRKGLAIGVLPANREGYPNEWVEIPIATHLPLSGVQGEDPRSRNHINVLTCAAIVVLPGGAGTLSEVRLALRYGKSIVAWLEDRSELAGLPAECVVVASLEDVERVLRQELTDL